MTEEQAFIEWKAEQYKHQSTEEELEFVEHLHYFPKYFKKTFLDGYHECEKEHEWHDLRKDKTDLPPKMVLNHNFSIEVLSDRGEIVCYNFHECEWFYWRSGKPIAWCEIPKFEE